MVGSLLLRNGMRMSSKTHSNVKSFQKTRIDFVARRQRRLEYSIASYRNGGGSGDRLTALFAMYQFDYLHG